MKDIPRPALVSGLALVLSLATSARGQQRPATTEDMHRLHADPKVYAAMLDDPARDAYQKPHEVVTALALKEGERIADIGAGSGYFALRFARHVGAQGRVYAVDISPDMILHLEERVRAAGLDNVRMVLARADDPLLPDASVDRIFICDTWHHIAGHAAYLERLRKALRPAGQVVIVDFQKKRNARRGADGDADRARGRGAGIPAGRVSPGEGGDLSPLPVLPDLPAAVNLRTSEDRDVEAGASRRHSRSQATNESPRSPARSTWIA